MRCGALCLALPPTRRCDAVPRPAKAPSPSSPIPRKAAPLLGTGGTFLAARPNAPPLPCPLALSRGGGKCRARLGFGTVHHIAGRQISCRSFPLRARGIDDAARGVSACGRLCCCCTWPQRMNGQRADAPGEAWIAVDLKYCSDRAAECNKVSPGSARSLTPTGSPGPLAPYAASRGTSWHS